MSMTAMNRAVARGIRRGIKMQSGDLTSIRKMRKEIETRDLTEEAWTEVGRALREVMAENPPTSTTTSSPSLRTQSSKK